jgi:hypothetical protein
MIIAFSLKVYKILLPQRLVITVSNECPFINRAKKVRISRIFDKRNIISPYFDISRKRLVFVLE